MPNFHEIRNRFGGDNEAPWFVIHSNDIIHAVCLRLDLNPNARQNPAEVWVGADPLVALWGTRLAFHTAAVALFVSPGYAQNYNEVGLHTVSRTSVDPQQLRQTMAISGIGKLSRIVYLVPAPELSPTLPP